PRDVHTVPELLGEEHMIARGDDRVERDGADRTVVRVHLVRAPRVKGHDSEGAHLADDGAHLAAEVQVHLDLAIVVSEEEAARHAETMGGLTLLLLAEL